MAGVVLEWKGPEVEGTLKKELLRRLERAAVLLEGEIKRTISKGGRRRIGNRMVSVPSPVGQPPHKQTGNLFQHVSHEMDKTLEEARVGVLPGAPYGTALEFGLGRLKGRARPFIRPTFVRVMSRLARMIGTGS